MIDEKKVAVYCQDIPSYDEKDVRTALTGLFCDLGFDSANCEKENWNPLSCLIHEGDTVLLKPNLIAESHATKKSWEEVITHYSVIFLVSEFAYKALNGKGKLLITDGPQTNSDFYQIYRILQFDNLKRKYLNTDHFTFDIFDLRKERWIERDGVIIEKIQLKGDRSGYTEIDLRTESEFVNHRSSRRYYGAEYNYGQTQSVHSETHNKYLISSSVLDADVVINLPKFKTHKKAGLTLSLKNMVGINGDKNYLPHHTMGTPSLGGDEFSNSSFGNVLQGAVTKVYKKTLSAMGGTGGPLAQIALKLGYKVFGKTENVVRSGNWYGNDTLWRMVLDLNKILFYFGSAGNTFVKPRRYLTIIDGIIAGENNGPSSPDRKECGILIAGLNPVAADTVAASIAGFDYLKIPTLKHAFEIKHYPLCTFSPSDIRIISNRKELNGNLKNLQTSETFHFVPHFGWKGHIELD